ncbi:MAG: oxidoreductase [Candidatus Sericytochromatia bacterium]
MASTSNNPTENRSRPRLAVWKFASCDGCQLTLLDCEDELLTLADQVEIVHFPEAGPVSPDESYDLSLVEGSISSPEDLERIHRIRAQSRLLATIGACASAGGIQALRNYADVSAFTAIVYARPEYISALARVSPIAEHVEVDFELRGCPISKEQLLELILALLAGRRPHLPSHSLCLSCKLKGNVCVLVAQNTPCLGPVTQAGCGAICPSYGRGCYACFGPHDSANPIALSMRLQALGVSEGELLRLYRSFNATAKPFDEEASRHG